MSDASSDRRSLVDVYTAAVTSAKAAIQTARTSAALAANSEPIALYWQLGDLILDRQS